MLSILIGHNNLCAFCRDAGKNGPETFGRVLEESVDILYSQVPRLFVNLLSPVDVTALYPASQGTLHTQPSAIESAPRCARIGDHLSAQVCAACCMPLSARAAWTVTPL